MNSESPLARRPPPPVPQSHHTGFLGAGKTTLLNRLLKDPALGDTVVLINEFGEIGLDHLLVETVDDDMILLSSGCLCCSIRGDLITTLTDLMRRRDNGRIKPVNRVVVETTGLADPAPILHTIMYHPYLILRYRLDGVISVVDAVNGLATLKDHDEALRQAAVADRLVITKTDLADTPERAASLAQLRLELRTLNPTARTFNAADADAARLLDAGVYAPDGKTPQVRAWLNAEAFEDSHAAHHHKHGHDHHAHGAHAGQDPHDVNRHDAAIRAFCLTSAQPIAPAAFDLFLDMMGKLHGPKMLRLKGIVALADDPLRPVVVHGVQHVFHPPLRLDAWPDDDHRTRLVFILRDLPQRFVEDLWAALTGGLAPDLADAAALGANPLAPSQGGLLG